MQLMLPRGKPLRRRAAVRATLNKIYADHTKQSIKTISSKMDRDFFFSGECRRRAPEDAKAVVSAILGLFRRVSR